MKRNSARLSWIATLGGVFVTWPAHSGDENLSGFALTAIDAIETRMAEPGIAQLMRTPISTASR